MTTRVSFEVEVTPDTPRQFAELSGDWNPLHTDPVYAASSTYGRPVLHGAFSAGLLSQVAGMHIPGRDCLLHGLKLRFVRPILPPTKLRVEADLVRDDGETGEVNVLVRDAETGATYTEGSYQFGRHAAGQKTKPAQSVVEPATGPRILVTGASGAIGGAVAARLGAKALRWSRGESLPSDTRLSAIVHCGWPAPDNTPLLDLGSPQGAIGHHIAQPLGDLLELAQLLARQGEPGALLLAIGSTFADPGRHAFRTPLYALAKSLLSTLTRILALELASTSMRAATLVLDVVDGGMNAGVSPAIMQMHADRVPSGELPTPAEVAEQVAWMLDNRSHLLSGAILSLTGGSLP